MVQPPGTISRILWHFTGGPGWNSAENRQAVKPKPAGEAYAALLSILKSKELRLGENREVVTVRLPKLPRRDKQTQKTFVFRSPEKVIKSTAVIRTSKVCCLSDIPVAHLSYHAKRYGKFAIGFHRAAAVRHGFNPVFYTLQDANVARSIREVLTQLRKVEDNSVDSIADDVEKSVQDLEDLECDQSGGVESDLNRSVFDLRNEVQAIEEAISSALMGYSRFAAFVKTFDKKEFSSIYCEREWRSTKQFSFTVDDLAMIVLPKSGRVLSYFNEFVNKGRTLKLPRSIPVVPWEDLIEH